MGYKYKIVCSDLDGTLLNNNAEISLENLQAIRELINRGVHFVPSTGRTFSELPAEIKNDDSIRYVIHSNGAVVLDRQTNQRQLVCMSNETTRKILDILYQNETHITVRHDGNCFIDASFADEESYDYYNVCEPHRVVLREFAIYFRDFKAFCYGLSDVEVISVFFHDYEEMIACKKQIEALGGLRIVGVSEFNLEIMNVHAGKGNALHSLADMLGVAHGDTISIGDSDNDASIVEAAGLGLAVSNACDSLKAVADEEICSNEEHAVAYVLSHYF